MKILDQSSGANWTLYNADCVTGLTGLPDHSVGYSLFSPPFKDLFTYSNLPNDIGNCESYDEFWQHFGYVIDHLARLTKPGRNVSVHCMDMPRMKERDGVIGVYDFPGDIIRQFESRGFIYHSRVAIWKDPLLEATRTRALGLQHKQLVKDSAMCRNGLMDYILTFRAPGENAEPIEHPDGIRDYFGSKDPGGGIDKRHHYIWQRYASPIWMDIRQTRVLKNYSKARHEKDEKHICPLQLDTIERCLVLWSNSGDVVLSPFAGIGSEGFVSVRRGRKFIGFELKESYYKIACENLRHAESELDNGDLLTYSEDDNG